MNKISSALLALSLISTASFSFAMEPMEKQGAMEKDAMKMEPMKKEGAMMMKAEPRKMKKQNDKMEQGGKMAMEPKK